MTRPTDPAGRARRRRRRWPARRRRPGGPPWSPPRRRRTQRGPGPERRLGRGVAHDDRHAEAPAHLGHHRRAASAPRPCRRRAARQVGPANSSAGQHQRPLRRHPLATVIALGRHDADGVVGPPRRRRDDRGHGVRDLVPGARHVAHVREGQGREPAVARLAQHVGAPGHRGQVGVVEERALGPARGPARPHHRHRVVGPRGRATRPAGRRPTRGRDLGRLHHAPRPAASGSAAASGSTTSSTGAARSRMEATSPRAHAGVDARGDGAQALQRGVEHGVVDARRQQQADDVALGDAAAGQVAGHAVGGAVPFGEGQRAALAAPAGST